MLRKEDFQSLNAEQQLQLLFESGNELLTRGYRYYNIKLFVLSGFFVEVWYHQKNNTVDKILLPDTDDVITLYENQIDINTIFR